MILHLSVLATRKLGTLLVEGLCTREVVIKRLVGLEYADGEADREADGYIVIGDRTMMLKVTVDEETAERCRNLCRVHQIRSKRGSSHYVSVAVEAILTDRIRAISESERQAVLGWKRLAEPSDQSRVTFYLSDHAFLGLQRLYQGTQPPTERRMRRLRKIMAWLSEYEFVRDGPTPSPRRRKKRTVLLSQAVLNHFAAEAVRLHVAREGGGRKSPTSAASQVLELIGLGVLIPSRITYPGEKVS